MAGVSYERLTCEYYRTYRMPPLGTRLALRRLFLCHMRFCIPLILSKVNPAKVPSVEWKKQPNNPAVIDIRAHHPIPHSPSSHLCRFMSRKSCTNTIINRKPLFLKSTAKWQGANAPKQDEPNKPPVESHEITEEARARLTPHSANATLSGQPL